MTLLLPAFRRQSFIFNNSLASPADRSNRIITPVTNEVLTVHIRALTFARWDGGTCFPAFLKSPFIFNNHGFAGRALRPYCRLGCEPDLNAVTLARYFAPPSLPKKARKTGAPKRRARVAQEAQKGRGRSLELISRARSSYRRPRSPPTRLAITPEEELPLDD
jgi:hypothetical protein